MAFVLPPTRFMDVSRWPVMLYTAPTSVSDDEMRAVMEEERMLKHLGEVHAMILDVRQVKQLSPTQRRMLTTQMDADKQVTEQFTAGVALVFESPMLRGILTAIFWVRPAIAPTRVFATPELAFAWCQAQVVAKQRSAA